MTRPKKQTVDYFPHDCNHGKTLFVLEQRYGNDGYAFWFKLLELIGNTEKHFLDCNDKPTWEFLLSRSHINSEIGWEMMNLLADLKAIDSELWENKIVWIDKFVKRIADAYRNRLSEIPKRPVILRKKPPETPQFDNDIVRNPQTKVKESKLKETTSVPPDRGNGVEEDFEKWWKAYPPRRKTGKPVAKAKWIFLTKTGKLLPVDKMIEVLEAQKKSQDWIKSGGDFIPGPIPYLNQSKYLDESINYEPIDKNDEYLERLARKELGSLEDIPL